MKYYGSVWDCTNSIMEQLNKKLEFVEYLSLGALTTPPFFLELSVWS